jgi:hypothetical protein
VARRGSTRHVGDTAFGDLNLCVGGFDRYVFLFHIDEVSTVLFASKAF